MPYKFPEQHIEATSLRHWRNNIKARYGLTLEEFEEILELQGGVCAICKQPEKDRYKRRLCVDHDHETGKVRGLLCHMCNTALGKFSDDPDRLDAAAAYLRSYEGEF